MTKNIRVRNFIGFLLIFFQVTTIYLLSAPKANATLTSAKDTISNSRLSFRAQVAGAVSSGGTFVTIGAGQSDADVQNLFQRDNICFADSGVNGCKGSVNYTVGSIPNQSGTSIELNSALATSLLTSDIAMASQSATHTVVFTTANTVNNPIIQVRIPAATQTAASNDGFPDYGSAVTSSGFDLAGLVAGDVTCSGTGPSWVATVQASTTTGGNYHQVTCTGTGTLNSATTVTITIGNTHKLINPAPITSGHTRGSADVYNITIRELDSGSSLVDSSTVAVAPVEGVLVSATVQNTLTFSIAGVASSTSLCGKSTSVTTTATTVPFSTITSGAFYNAAHLLTVSTNAVGGYSVTAVESGPLSIDGLGVTTLADTTCPSNSCTTTTPADWTSNASSGFGYSLVNSSGTDASFQYNDTSRTFNAKPFDSVTPRTIMTKNGPVNGSAVDVCYQISTSGTQQAGYYLNKLTYVATPIF